MEEPKTSKLESLSKNYTYINCYWLYFGRQKFMLNQLNGVGDASKRTVLDLVSCSCRKTLWHPLLFLSRAQLLGVVSPLEAWGFIGTHNPVVSMIMNIYSMLVKFQVEACTFWIKRLKTEPFRITDALKCPLKLPRHSLGWIIMEPLSWNPTWNSCLSRAELLSLQTGCHPSANGP